MTLKCIAQRLNMGTWTHVSNLLSKAKNELCVKARRKGETKKARLAAQLRAETIMTWPWTAKRLWMGHWRTASNATRSVLEKKRWLSMNKYYISHLRPLFDPGRRLKLHAATRERIFREVFEQYWQYVQCMPERTRHTLNAAWRLVVESWLRRQGWISVRLNTQTNVSTIYKPFHSQN